MRSVILCVLRVITDGVIECRSMMSRAAGKSSFMWTFPDSRGDGQPVMFTARSVTGCVAAETALSDPDPFVAVTRARQLLPLSESSIRTWGGVVWGGMVTKQPDPSAPPPSPGQLSHW